MQSGKRNVNFFEKDDNLSPAQDVKHPIKNIDNFLKTEFDKYAKEYGDYFLKRLAEFETQLNELKLKLIEAQKADNNWSPHVSSNGDMTIFGDSNIAKLQSSGQLY